MSTSTSAAAPESLLAAPDQASQRQISDEIAAIHARTPADAARTLHDFAPYRSSVLRHPTKNPRLVFAHGTGFGWRCKPHENRPQHQEDQAQ